MATSLRIAIVHYHLRAGGVTRVITSAAKALTERGHQVAIFTGDIPERYEAPEGVSIQKLAGLDYTFVYSPSAVDALDAEFFRAAVEAFGTLPDVWHFHNHSLGKNPNLPFLIDRWAHEEHMMLLQIHDFAENGRPKNYAALLKAAENKSRLDAMLYPHSPRIRYAVLNHRDLRILQNAGAGDHVSVLPNPVEMMPPDAMEFSPSQLKADAFTLYPCRPLGRKNIGEALLWSLYFEKGEKLLFPVAPENPVEQTGYSRWKTSASTLQLPVEFEALARFECSLESLMAASRQILTTSVMEGFGMAFLEPWLAGKSLSGRNLPDVTADFSAEGVKLDNLYQSLPVPVAWIGKEHILRGLDSAMKSLGNAYETMILEEWMEAVQLDFGKNDLMDFGLLGDELQREILHSLSCSATMKKEIPVALWRSSDFVDENAAAVRKNYSAQSYVERIEGIYSDLVGSPITPVDSLDGNSILQCNLRDSLPMALRIASPAIR